MRSPFTIDIPTTIVANYSGNRYNTGQFSLQAPAMTNEELHLLISKHMPNSQVIIGGDGHHFDATIISEAFAGLSKIKRQQMVYKELSFYITSGAIHALNLNTYTPEEWEQQNG